ncbi:hypothetical protein TESS_TESS_02727 [Tessaracoccus sp. O5.2]|uniref:FAD:protein FMN transferase n=1 Tax=Tessaracoccus sp. O5.2 TaxID=3157622 RepID=UPI0035EF848C
MRRAPESALAAVDLMPRRAFVAQIMGLPIAFHVRGPLARGAVVENAVERAFDELRADDDLFSTWKPDSPVSRIRDGRDSLDDAPLRIRRVAALCDEARQRTGGAFSAWLPDGHGARRFDPTGLVKGWAVEQALRGVVARLDPLGAHDVLVNAGGDIAVHCSRTDTPDWAIAVEDPRDRRRVVQRLELRTGAVATSGTAARGRHITDPSTGEPANKLLSATVIGPELMWADVYATAAFVLGRSGLGWLATRPAHAAVLVDHDGSVTTIRG